MNILFLVVYESYCKDEFNNCQAFASRGDCKSLQFNYYYINI